MTGPIVRSWARLGPAGPLGLGRIVALLAGLVAVIVSARLYGPEGRGVLAAYAVLQFIGATGLGLGTGSGAFLGTHRGDLTASQAASGLLAFGVCLGAVTSIAAGLAAIVGVWSIAVPDTSFAVAVSLGPAVLGQYLIVGGSQLAMGMAATRRSALGLTLGPVVMLGSVGVAAAVGLDVPALIVVQAAAWAAAGLAFVIVGGRSRRPGLGAARQILRIGRGGVVGDLTNALSYRLDVLLVVTLAGSAAAGVYSLATQFMEPLWIFASSVAGGLLIGSRGLDPVPRRALATAATVRVAWLTAVGAIAVVVVLPAAAAAAGAGFESAPLAGAVLAPGLILLACAKVLAAYQISLGRLWLGSLIATSSLVVSIAAGLILIPAFGAIGAGIASSISYATAFGLWLIAYRGVGPGSASAQSTTRRGPDR